jgi:hypothetical protein
LIVSGIDIQYNEHARMKDSKQNIRYLGFESTEDGGRKFDFSITAAGKTATRVSLIIPALMFSGANRISFQESAKICYEKLRVLLEHGRIEGPQSIPLTVDDIARFRHVPRGRRRPDGAGGETDAPPVRHGEAQAETKTAK